MPKVLAGVTILVALLVGFVPTGAQAQSSSGGTGQFAVNLNIQQVNFTGAVGTLQIVLKNTASPTTVEALSTFVHSESSDLTLSTSLKVTVFGSKSILFTDWSLDSGFLTASTTERLLIQNTTAAFPVEEIRLDLFFGSNYTLEELPIVTISIPTYEVTHEVSSPINSNYTKTNPYAPPGVSDLLKTYRNVYLLDLTIGHSTDLQRFVGLLHVTPFVILLIAGSLFMVFVFGLPFRRGPTPGEAIAGLVTALLFIPLYLMSVGQTIPSGESIFLKQWLSQTALLATSIFIIIAALTLATVLLSVIRKETH
jgi:hypothetical protein